MWPQSMANEVVNPQGIDVTLEDVGGLDDVIEDLVRIWRGKSEASLAGALWRPAYAMCLQGALACTSAALRMQCSAVRRNKRPLLFSLAYALPMPCPAPPPLPALCPAEAQHHHAHAPAAALPHHAAAAEARGAAARPARHGQDHAGQGGVGRGWASRHGIWDCAWVWRA